MFNRKAVLKFPIAEAIYVHIFNSVVHLLLQHNGGQVIVIDDFDSARALIRAHGNGLLICFIHIAFGDERFPDGIISVGQPVKTKVSVAIRRSSGNLPAVPVQREFRAGKQGIAAFAGLSSPLGYGDAAETFMVVKARRRALSGFKHERFVVGVMSGARDLLGICGQILFADGIGAWLHIDDESAIRAIHLARSGRIQGDRVGGQLPIGTVLPDIKIGHGFIRAGDGEHGLAGNGLAARREVLR